MVNPFIENAIKGKPEDLYEASFHLIKAGGKRLRPTFVFLSHELFGGNVEKVIPAAAAVEILHNFTLIHDDIMDKDELRRGVPTVHRVWGEPLAILAGDLLFAKSYEALLKLSDYGINADIINQCVKELTWGAITVAEGQSMDMDFEKRWNVTIEEYLEMIYKKTSALFIVSVALGTLTAGVSGRDLKLMKEYARNVGISFQIRDDELGLIGDEKVLGKPILSDLREGKKTILVIYALNNLVNDEVRFLKSILGKRNAKLTELKQAAELIKKSGALEFSNKLAEKYKLKGLQALSNVNVKNEEAYKLLLELTDFLTKRIK